MATRVFTRTLFTTKQTLSSFLSRSYVSVSLSAPSSSLSSLSILRLRPLVSIAANFHRHYPAETTVRGYSTRRTSSSLNDPNPNWSNRPPKETILLDGCDFEHWLVVVEKPEGDPTRDEIIDSYIKILAQVVGSEDEARMKIYSVSTKHYFAFGALVSEELSYKLKELPRVRWVLPDSYLDVRNKDYGGEPFINGQAVPYDPKYHEEWVRNNARANDRNRRNDRPRNFDRSRNFERRRENRDFQMNNRDMQNPSGFSPPPNVGGPPPPGNMGGMPQTNTGGPPPQYNTGVGQPQYNTGVGQPQYNTGVSQPQYNTGGGMLPNNMGGGMAHNNMGGNLQYNTGGIPQNNMGAPSNPMGVPPTNMGGPSNPMGVSPSNMGGPSIPMGVPPSNMGGHSNPMGVPPPNMGGHSNQPMGVPPPNMGGPPNPMGVPPSNMGGPPNPMRVPPNMGGFIPPNNTGGSLRNTPPNFQYGRNLEGMPGQNRETYGPGQNREFQHNNFAPNSGGGNPYQTQDVPPNYQRGRNLEGMPSQNRETSGPGEFQHSNFAPNSGVGNPYHTQDVPGRDAPEPPNYQ